MTTPEWGTVNLLEIVAGLAALAGLWISAAGLRSTIRARCLLRAAGRNGYLLAVSNANIDSERLRIAAQLLMLANVGIVLALPNTSGWAGDEVNLVRAGVSACLLLMSVRAQRLRHELLAGARGEH